MVTRAGLWRRSARVAAGALLLAASAAPAAILYAGSYTSGTSKGIYAWRFDARAGTLRPLGLVAATPQPAHLSIARSGRFLYAVNWEEQGGVSAFRIDAATGALTLLNRVAAHGAQPNQVALDPSGRIAVTVTYATGNVVAYRVQADGTLSDAFWVDQHVAPADAPARPPRTHGIAFSPDGRLMYIADLGLDRVYVYHLDATRASVTPAATPFVTLHRGAGPRRLQISRDGRFVYVNHETDSEVSVLAATGDTLAEVQTLRTLPDGFMGKNSTAEVVLARDGRTLYVSNRGHDSIVAFTVDPRTGRLSAPSWTPSGGRTPRNIALDPSGRFLFAANENGGSITAFRVDRATGRLTALPLSAPIDRPGAIAFLRRG